MSTECDTAPDTLDDLDDFDPPCDYRDLDLCIDRCDKPAQWGLRLTCSHVALECGDHLFYLKNHAPFICCPHGCVRAPNFDDVVTSVWRI